jgi:hypothetical protein
MVTQFNPGFPLEIQKYGCYFLSLLRIVEIESGKDIPIGDVVIFFELMKQAGFIRRSEGAIEDDCYLARPDLVLENAFRRFNGGKTAHQFGAAYGAERCEFWGTVRVWQCSDGITVRGGQHYRLLDALGQVVYDSWPGTVVTGERKRVFYMVVSR